MAIMRPILLDWSIRRAHLQEVTRDDVLPHLARRKGDQWLTTMLALDRRS
jgi:hypothetical protein